MRAEHRENRKMFNFTNTARLKRLMENQALGRRQLATFCFGTQLRFEWVVPAATELGSRRMALLPYCIIETMGELASNIITYYATLHALEAS